MKPTIRYGHFIYGCTRKSILKDILPVYLVFGNTEKFHSKNNKDIGILPDKKLSCVFHVQRVSSKLAKHICYHPYELIGWVNGEMVISPNAISPKVISPNVFGHFA